MKTGGDPDGLDVGKECALSIPKQLTDSLRADSEQRVAQEDQPMPSETLRNAFIDDYARCLASAGNPSDRPSRMTCDGVEAI
jgi:hypothetical protein